MEEESRQENFVWYFFCVIMKIIRKESFLWG